MKRKMSRPNRAASPARLPPCCPFAVPQRLARAATLGATFGDVKKHSQVRALYTVDDGSGITVARAPLCATFIRFDGFFPHHSVRRSATNARFDRVLSHRSLIGRAGESAFRTLRYFASFSVTIARRDVWS